MISSKNLIYILLTGATISFFSIRGLNVAGKDIDTKNLSTNKEVIELIKNKGVLNSTPSSKYYHLSFTNKGIEYRASYYGYQTTLLTTNAEKKEFYIDMKPYGPGKEDFYWNETNGIEIKSDYMKGYERKMHFTESNLELKNIPELWKTRDKL